MVAVGANPAAGDGSSPFEVRNVDAYKRWRDGKLASCPSRIEDLMVEIGDLAHPRESEVLAIRQICRRGNVAVHVCRVTDDDPAVIRGNLLSFTTALGLSNLEAHRSAADDGIVALEVVQEGPRSAYIPYTARPLNWHTDGYYNPPGAQIRAMVLHCVQDAARGGETGLLDPEIAYIRLREISPDLVAALMRPDAMTIPGNTERDGTTRPASVGPVFSIGKKCGTLHMRFSTRKRNIIWRDDENTRASVEALADLLERGDDVIRYRLQPGQGITSNNVLHNRSGFENGSGTTRQRLYLRARYAERIAGT